MEGDGLVWRTDTGHDDNGTAYTATLTTKPFVHGSLLNQFEVKSAALLAEAAHGTTLDVTISGNFGAVTKPAQTLTLDPAGDETRVIRTIDDLSLAELVTMQITFTDPASVDQQGQWSLEQFAMRETRGQGA